jgi:hypothetical protein
MKNKEIKIPQKVALKIYDQYKDSLILLYDCLVSCQRQKKISKVKEIYHFLAPNLLAALLAMSKSFGYFLPLGKKYKIDPVILTVDIYEPMNFIFDKIYRRNLIILIDAIIVHCPQFAIPLEQVKKCMKEICNSKRLLSAPMKVYHPCRKITIFDDGEVRAYREDFRSVVAEDMPCFAGFKQKYYEKWNRCWGLFSSKNGMIELLQNGKITTFNEVIIYAKNRPNSRTAKLLKAHYNINVTEATAFIVEPEADIMKVLSNFFPSDLGTIIARY